MLRNHPQGMPLVAILMCTYNAEKYLDPQMKSFDAQTYPHWELWVSDDGSSDTTLAGLNKYVVSSSHPIHVLNGPCKGFSRNFLSLLERANPLADMYAFSDQDDVWNSDKIDRAVYWLKTIPDTVPALYCSRTELTDSDLNTIGFSPLFTKPPELKNALIQNIAGGNTMVINKAARELLLSAGNIDVPYHDWWAYLAVTAAGGSVYYDPTPALLYRQHASNVVGASGGLLSRLKRSKKIFGGQNQSWITRNLKALDQISSRIPPVEREIIRGFVQARESGFLKRVYLFLKLGLYRQSRIEDAYMLFLCILGRL
jgi:glycosyltransferase involved in cell wall biosynthesis